MKKLLSVVLALLMLAVMLPVTAMAEEGATGDGSQSNPYTLAQFNALTRQQYIDAQNQLGGTMYVTVEITAMILTVFSATAFAMTPWAKLLTTAK